MVTSSIIKYLLCDDNSLGDYHSGMLPKFDDICRRLFLLDRQSDRNIPDHYYRLNSEYTFKNIKNIPQIFTIGLYQIADKYLELRGTQIYVKPNMQNHWQELITYIPPLILISALLAREVRFNMKSIEKVKDFYHEYIVPNTRYTALPHPYLPQLELYVKENKGFHDLHMHLNGATETDITWQDYLFQPDKAYKDFKKGYDEYELVREQYEQESYILNPLRYHNFLYTAMRLRSYFFESVFPVERNNEPSNKFLKNAQDLFRQFNSCTVSELFPGSVYHPFYQVIYSDADKAGYNTRNLLSIEALMYIYIINKLTLEKHNVLSQAFHYYLLILGITNRLLVQQTHQYGFTQFKKITVNELRERSEHVYYNRFFQLQGNTLRNLNLLEGRFAPKDTTKKLEKLLADVQAGWESLEKHIRAEWKLAESKGMTTKPLTMPQLKLVAHFIKMADTNPDDNIRHKKLRYRVWNQALIMSFLKKNDSIYMKNVVAADAASSEFDTPPEVFAPAFRMLRRNGFKHFTYHAGEDFYHILCGLRAIYEAVEYNNLKTGDRIGHATASGLSPQVWKDNIGKVMLMKKGEYMDDLLFAYHLIIERSAKYTALMSLKTKIPFLASRIQEFSNEIYGRYYPLKSLEDAWMLRKYCPMILQSITLTESQAWKKFQDENPVITAERLSVFDFNEWCEIRKELKGHFIENESVDIYQKYHKKKYRDIYNEIIEIEVEDMFSLEELEQLQLAVLHYLHEKEIIIETLPSSNIRIGHHASFSTYHLWNWLRWDKEGHSIPPIVVGTDDTGIFATNIFNEFANIYCFLTNEKKMSHTKAMEIIMQLEKNARIYRFL